METMNTMSSQKGQAAPTNNDFMDEIRGLMGPLRELMIRQQLAEERAKAESGNAAIRQELDALRAQIATSEREARAAGERLHIAGKVDTAINQISSEVQAGTAQAAAGFQGLASQTAAGLQTLASQQATSAQLGQMQQQSGNSQLLSDIRRETDRMHSRLDGPRQSTDPPIMAVAVPDPVLATPLAPAESRRNSAASFFAQPQPHVTFNPVAGLPDSAVPHRIVSVQTKTPNDLIDHFAAHESANDAYAAVQRKTNAAMTGPQPGEDATMYEGNARKRLATEHTFADKQPDTHVRTNDQEPAGLDAAKQAQLADMRAMNTDQGEQEAQF
jgi:hypothetical protein